MHCYFPVRYISMVDSLNNSQAFCLLIHVPNIHDTYKKKLVYWEQGRGFRSNHTNIFWMMKMSHYITHGNSSNSTIQTIKTEIGLSDVIIFTTLMSLQKKKSVIYRLFFLSFLRKHRFIPVIIPSISDVGVNLVHYYRLIYMCDVYLIESIS